MLGYDRLSQVLDCNSHPLSMAKEAPQLSCVCLSAGGWVCGGFEGLLGVGSSKVRRASEVPGRRTVGVSSGKKSLL